MLKRSEMQVELGKAKGLVERMAEATNEMRNKMQESDAKLKVMEAWVCVIMNETEKQLRQVFGNEAEIDSRITLERTAIGEALRKYRLNVEVSEDEAAFILSVREAKTNDEAGDTRGASGDERNVESEQPEPSCVREDEKGLHGDGGMAGEEPDERPRGVNH